MRTAKTPREARAKPGRKMLTPLERALIDRMTAEYRKAWEALLLRNKWRAGK
jgi:hypothetical protein